MKYKVKDLFRKLSNGPLSNLAISNEGSGTIVESGKNKLVDYINDGLTRLYSKFILSEKELILRTIQGRVNYPLESKHTVTYYVEHAEDDPPSLVPIFIMDDLNPFQDDLIKVLAIFDTEGTRIPLNDAEDPMSVFTPTTHLLQIPWSGDAVALSVMYQAKHVFVPYQDEEFEISIPDCLWTALTSYVAAEVYSHMGGQENTAKGQEYLLKYEIFCQEAIDNDLVNNAMSNTNTNFEKRGWV